MAILRVSQSRYSASVVNLANGLVGFYGGFEQLVFMLCVCNVIVFDLKCNCFDRLANTAIPQITASGATMAYWADNGTAVGFSSMQVYSPDSMVSTLEFYI